MRSIVFLTTVLFIGCSNDVYEYHGKKYKIYRQADLGKQVNFEAVDLSNSRDSIPSIIFKQSELILLDLNNKDLKILPSEVCSLKKIRVLLMKNNLGIQLPECFDSLKHLEVLSLLGCQLKELPDQLLNMPNLKMLVIGGNHFDDADLIKLKNNLPDTNIITSTD